MNGHQTTDPHNSRGVTVSGTTFSFRKRWAQIDWRTLACVDIDRIAREMDVQTLQENIMNITYCNISSEEFQNVDRNFIKLFQLSQLIVEYLLYTQQYLTEQINGLEEQVKRDKQELTDLKNDHVTKQEEIKSVKRENRKRRKMIESYQQMLKAGATGLHPCPVCKREFVSAEYLQGHIDRRHPDHFKESHNIPQQQTMSCDTNTQEIQYHIMEQVTEKLLQSELQLKEQISSRESQLIEEKLREFNELKKQEQQQMKMEFEEYRTTVMNELHHHKQETDQLQIALQKGQDELKALKGRRSSHLGHLEGSEEIDLTNKKTKEQVDEMKNHMQTQLDSMSDKLKKQKKQWKEKLKLITDKHKQQLLQYSDRIQLLEETSQSHEGYENESMKQELINLHQRLKKQESKLSNHQKHLLELKEREVMNVTPSPVKGEQDSDGEEEEEEEEEEDEEEEEEEEETSGRDQVFIPFKHRPFIKSKYNHDTGHIESMRHVVTSVLQDSTKKRGIDKGAVGLNNELYKEKCRLLEQERETRINTHYNFVEHRERLANEVDHLTNIHSTNEVDHLTNIHYTNEVDQLTNIHYTSPIQKVNRKPMTVHSVSPSHVNTPLTTPPVSPIRQYEVPKHSVKTPPKSRGGDSTVSINITNKKPPPAIKIIKDKEKEEDSLTELSEEDNEDNVVPFTNEDDSPWESDDSIEKLIIPNNGKVSSTPIKSLEPNIGLDPSKRPPGGVPVMIIPHPPDDMESDDSDTFTFSESSAPPKILKPINSQDIPLIGNIPKRTSGTGVTVSSRSALTTISSTIDDDFDDSDFSDIEVTHLT